MLPSACSMPPSVSSENTTPKPNVSSAAFRSQTVISLPGSSCRASAAKYSPPGPPPMTAIRTGCPSAGRGLRAGGLLTEYVALHLAGRAARQRGHELDRPRVLVRRDLLLGEVL